MGSGQFQESRSYSTNDLSVTTWLDPGTNGNASRNHSNELSKVNRQKKIGNTTQKDCGILKRFAPGPPSGYYSYRFYHSLPHHYKLPVLSTRTFKEHTKEEVLSDYSEKLNLVVNWFKEFNDEQKNQMLASLVNECEQPQNHLLSMLLQDKLHISCPPNCQDFLLWLPPLLSYKILSYLDPISLAKCSQVCRYWQTLTNTQFLWQNLALHPTWRLGHAGHHRQMNLILERDNRICWKKVPTLVISTIKFQILILILGLC